MNLGGIACIWGMDCLHFSMSTTPLGASHLGCYPVISMNEIPEFEVALSSFREFLRENGHPMEIVWIFRDDVWKRSKSEVFLRVPSQERNSVLAQKVFNEGRRKGLVDVSVIAITDERVAATVWFPRTENDEIQGWNGGMKLTISEPLMHAKTFSSLRWWWFSFHGGFRHYQTHEISIGTRKWAAA
jgi:hypothetical protein